MKELILYIKTTETCQLNCAHCFTSGRNGAKVYFNPTKTIDWLHRLRDYIGPVQNPSVAFHGGEPFLAPVNHMREVYDSCHNLWDNFIWTTTTNLVYNLTDEKYSFMEECLKGRVSTSWDNTIRFENKQQVELWESNVRKLTSNPKFDVNLIMSIDKSLMEVEPIALISYAANLGVKNIHLERISLTGNAVENKHIVPDNRELDAWLLRWFEQSIEHKVWEWAPSCSLFKDVLSAYFYQTHHGCRCRNNESKTFTVNATGTIGGCPNKAVNKVYGNINQSIETLINSPIRYDGIVCEMNRNPACYGCPVFDLCNGDCDCLYWQDDVCAAPKSIMLKIKTEKQDDIYRKLLGNFVGVE